MNYPPNHILTHSGRLVNPLDLKPELIDREDIAISLSRIPRFLGHTAPKPYTVAEHCVRVARTLTIFTPAARLAALLHDAHEAYCGDVPRPIRLALRLADGRTWEDVEAAARRQVHLAFGLPEVLPGGWEAAIRVADDAMLAAELHQLMGQPAPVSTRDDPKQILCSPWDQDRALTAFLDLLEAYQTSDQARIGGKNNERQTQTP